MEKVAIILRGVSGSGKSSFADFLGNYLWNSLTVCICSADDYHLDKNGVYRFDLSKMGEAHVWCREKFERCLSDNFDVVILSNTNTSEKEIQPYLDLAAKYNYKVISLVVENRHGGKNIHNVPEETLQKQQQRLKSSIKLR